MTVDQDSYRTHDLLFGVRRSVRYHMRRRAFYADWNEWTNIAAAVLAVSAGSAIIADVDVDLWLSSGLAFLAGLLSIVNAMVGTARRAELHGELARRFIYLEQEFAHGRSLDDDAFEAAMRKRLEIEASEPPVLRLLDAMCHYELKRSIGHPPDDVRIPFFRRLVANWISQETFARQLPD